MTREELTLVVESLQQADKVLAKAVRSSPNDEYMDAAFRTWKLVGRAMKVVGKELTQLELSLGMYP